MTGPGPPGSSTEAAAAIDRAAALLGPRARRHVPVGPLTTYRVGGAAALFLEAGGEDDLVAAAAAVEETAIEVLVVGRGSNMLVSDLGFPGLVVSLGPAFAGVAALDGHRVRAGAATSLPVVARRTAALGLTGMEWAVGVPGSVGGAVRMNAGGHGSDMAASLLSVRSVDLRGHQAGVAVEQGREALRLGYRQSAVADHQVIVSVEMQLEPGDRAASEALIADIVRWRRLHQPGGQNAGSVFTNPEGDSAGRLIEAAGLKGHRRGSAFVSPKHANFFQVDDGGSAEDVRALIEEVAATVQARTGVTLHPELRMIGFRTPG